MCSFTGVRLARRARIATATSSGSATNGSGAATNGSGSATNERRLLPPKRKGRKPPPPNQIYHGVISGVV